MSWSAYSQLFRRCVLLACVLPGMLLQACDGTRHYGPAGDFSLTTGAGEKRTLHSYGIGTPEQPGSHYLLINFWASWCRPCVQEIPLLKKLAADHNDELIVLGIAADRLEPAQAFAQRMAIDYPLLYGEYAQTEALMRAYGNSRDVLPYSLLIDPAGQIIWRHTGLLRRADLQRLPLPHE